MMRIFTLFFILTTVSLSAQNVYWSEDFDAGLPDGWVLEGEFQITTPNDASSQFFTVPEGNGLVAVFNDDGLGEAAVGGGHLQTAAIDLTSVSGQVWLEMRSYFVNGDWEGADETAKIFVSRDEGANWTEAFDQPTTSVTEFGVAFFDMSEYAGETVWLDFVYDDGDGWNYGWAFDEINIADDLQLVTRRSYAVHAGGAIMMDDAAPGTEYTPTIFVANQGIDPIESFDVELTNGTDVFTDSFTGMDIQYLGVEKIDLSQSLVVEGNTEWTVSITNVNGSMEEDDDASNDAMSFNLNAESGLDPDKGVAVEEATGTWCTWCPRGSVFLDEMAKRFPDNFVGIAVHNNDPMQLNEYDSAIRDFPGFAGFPSVVYQRDTILDPSEIVNPSINDMKDAPVARLNVGGAMNGDEFTAAIQVEFLEDTDDDYNIAIVLTEDGLSGTTDGWIQINAYAGGGNGPMGGYELLPGQVPAEFMVYDHVGRALIGDFEGVGGVITGDHSAGDRRSYAFDEYNMSPDFNLDNVHVVGLLLNDDGEIVNARSVSFEDALSTGTFTDIKEIYDNSIATIYPNPAYESTGLYLNLVEATDVTVTLTNNVGQVVSTQRFNHVSTNARLDIDVANLVPGVYMANILAGEKMMTQKITKAGK